jgi:hypothetical protein
MQVALVLVAQVAQAAVAQRSLLAAAAATVLRLL